MKIGTYRMNITPSAPFYLIGFRSENRMYPADGVHDPIFANALLFEAASQTIFFLSADVLEFEESMADDVKQRLHDAYGLDPSCVFLCATHDHSSTVAYHKSWYTGKYSEAYYEWFVGEILNAYAKCQSNKQEATAVYGKQIITGFYGNRNHPGELADNEVIVVKFLDAQGHPFAGLINWAVHSTVISADNTWLSADLAGNVSTLLNESFGFYPAMFVGAAGDCSNHNERQGHGFKELSRVSQGLAQAIAQIPCDQVLGLGDIELVTFTHTIDHDMSFVHQEIRPLINKMKQEIQEETDLQKKQMLEKRMHHFEEKLNISHFHLDIHASLLKIGDLQIILFPSELGSDFGKQLKASRKELTLVFGYTNGYYEYFMPAKEYGLSFETIGCCIPQGEPERIIEEYLKRSEDLDRRKDK